MSDNERVWILEARFSPDDHPDAAARLAERPAHRERLAARYAAGVVLIAGPWADGSGSMVVLDVPDRAAAQAVVDSDPYYSTPGVEVVSVRELTPLDL